MSSDKPTPRILFVRPEYRTVLPRRVQIIVEPLDLEYLAAVAVAEGCEYMIHDPVVTRRSWESVLEEFKPDIVAITGYYPAKDHMLRYAQRAKRWNASTLTLIGGVHAEINYTDFYSDTVDLVVHSGGAATFRRILQALGQRVGTSHPSVSAEASHPSVSAEASHPSVSAEASHPSVSAGTSHPSISDETCRPSISNVAGTCHRSPGGEWCSKERTTLDLSGLPIPDRSHFYQHYEEFAYLHHGPVALLKTAYGCPFDCSFCYCKLLNEGQYSAREMEGVVAEIKQIQCDRIWIVDDTFLLDMERALSFADSLKKEGVSKEFIIYSRSEFIAKNPEVVPVLKQAGVIDVIIGFEAITEAKLKDYNKSVTEAEGRRCVRLLREGGIECTGLFIMDPDASFSDIRALDRWIRRAGLTTFTLSVFSPFPGTEPYDECRDRLTTTDCHKWDLLHLVTEPTRMSRTSFYLLMFWMHLKVLYRNKALRRHLLSFRRRAGRAGS